MAADRTAASGAALDGAAADVDRAIDEAVRSLEERLIALRRHLHAHPEASGEEYATTAFLAETLRAEGWQLRVAPSQRGVIAEPPPPPAPPTRSHDPAAAAPIVLRADIDGLRLQDAKDVPYRSVADGLCHACGHDLHVACVVGAALALESCRDLLPAPARWRIVLQPAEESSLGAREMIEAGAIEGARAIIALHVDPEWPLGTAAFRSGMMTAYCDELDVVVRGHGGHAARPHHSADPIAAAAQFINTVYQFVPRAIDSREPVVVTFGLIQGGFTQNVIPEEVRLRGTARTHSHAATSRVEDRIRDIARGTGTATGTSIDVAFKRGPAAVVNDSRITEACREAARQVVGIGAIGDIPLASMGGEDFADYLTQIPGCLFRLGVGSDAETVERLHSPRFDPPEAAISIGARILARALIHTAQLAA